jgi:hypothetical protein
MGTTDESLWDTLYPGLQLWIPAVKLQIKRCGIPVRYVECDLPGLQLCTYVHGTLVPGTGCAEFEDLSAAVKS